MSVQKASLKPHLNEIRQWVEQGRTDIWIAHALSSTPASISAFRSAHGILRRDLEGRGSTVPPPVIPPDAPPIEEPTRPRRRSRRRSGEASATGARGREKPEREKPSTESPRARTRSRGGSAKSQEPPAAEPPAAEQPTDQNAPAAAEDDAAGTSAKRRRRGGRGRGKKAPTYEATLDAGDEGYGFWMDGAVRDDPVFAEHWAGRRALVVRITADEIVVRADERHPGDTASSTSEGEDDVSDKSKPLPRRLEAFRDETGMDAEAFVAGFRDGSIEQTDENRQRAREAEELWEQVKAQEPAT